MALEAKRAAFNLAMATVFDKWDDLWDGLSAGEKVLLLPVLQKHTGVAGTTMDNTDGTSPAFPTDPKLQRRVVMQAKISTSDNAIDYFVDGVDLGGWPLFFYITNDAGELA